jgi:hypothetical protein
MGISVVRLGTKSCRRWRAKMVSEGFFNRTGTMSATITAKNTRPSPLTLSDSDDWQACLFELEKLNSQGGELA